MKRTWFSLILSAIVATLLVPIALAESADDEKIIRRIFIRDGEVIEMDDPEAFRFNLDEGLLHGERTYLGVHAIDISRDLRKHYGAAEDRGVLVSTVGEGTPAAKAGIRSGDVIVTINGKAVTSAGNLRSLIRDLEAGSNAEIEVIRNGARQKLFATLEKKDLGWPRIRLLGEGDGIQYRMEQSEESLKKLQEFFDSPGWKSRVMKLEDCSETQLKLEKVQKRLEELEKKLEKMK